MKRRSLRALAAALLRRRGRARGPLLRAQPPSGRAVERGPGARRAHARRRWTPAAAAGGGAGARRPGPDASTACATRTWASPTAPGARAGRPGACCTSSITAARADGDAVPPGPGRVLPGRPVAPRGRLGRCPRPTCRHAAAGAARQRARRGAAPPALQHGQLRLGPALPAVQPVGNRDAGRGHGAAAPARARRRRPGCSCRATSRPSCSSGRSPAWAGA